MLETIIAHRGASAYAPENTLAAFNKVLDFNCRFIEFDVVLSADGQPFVFHDKRLERTTNGQGAIGQVTAKYLRALNAGAWYSELFINEKIPDLMTVVQWLTAHNVQANIEIKPYPKQSKQTAEVVLKTLADYWPPNKPLPLLSSFDKQALNVIAENKAGYPLGLLERELTAQSLHLAQELSCYSIHLWYQTINETVIQQAHQQGYKLLAYTVNSLKIAKHLLTLGVDAIFSNYPNLLNCCEKIESVGC